MATFLKATRPLSGTLLHRKPRNAGIEADLNVFEGMWHFFWENPDLPELREAMTALARFLNRHLE
jgi:acetyl esterase/lipase